MLFESCPKEEIVALIDGLYAADRDSEVTGEGGGGRRRREGKAAGLCDSGNHGIVEGGKSWESLASFGRTVVKSSLSPVSLLDVSRDGGGSDQ